MIRVVHSLPSPRGPTPSEATIVLRSWSEAQIADNLKRVSVVNARFDDRLTRARATRDAGPTQREIGWSVMSRSFHKEGPGLGAQSIGRVVQ